MLRPPAPSPPELRPDDEPLLDALLALPPEARAERLREERAASPERVARLAPLLAELEADDGFLAPPPAAHAALLGALCAAWPGPADRPLLDPGAQLGPYTVTGRVGRGGMGEVYRARDRDLGRDVALKVFPHALDGDDQRLARLRREARLVAALNHPNIAAIYGTVSDEDVSALVLEFVDGPTLADRLRAGPLGCADAIAVARQLVDALEAARARRIVHRDLKPANIAFARDGRVKVLDFGIATVWRGDPATASVSASLLNAALDTPGLVAGTAAYMSPEQVRGDTVGHRTDVWAFGGVLFEMLAGVRAFGGDTTGEVMARVLAEPPALDRLPPSTPGALRTLIARCLEKDPAARLASIVEARPALEDAARALAAPGPPVRRPPRWWAWAVAGTGLAVVAAVTLALWPGRVPAGQAPVVRLTLPLPATDELVTGAQPAIALTPDGRTVVYRARRDGTLQLFRRDLGAGEPVALAGTANAAGPFLSPDGEWVGFHLDGVLMKAPMRGGPPVRIAEVGGGGAAGSWSQRDEILFAPVPGRGLFRVPAAGGTPIAVTAVDPTRGETSHGFPEVLPQGKAALFTVADHAGTWIATVDLATGATSRLTAGRQARYLPGGILLVARDDVLWAAPFDPERLTVRDAFRPVTRGLDAAGTAQFAVSAAGTLAFVPPRDLVPPRRLVWIDRNGEERPAVGERRRYVRASLSPDGTRIAIAAVEDGDEDLWVHDLRREATARLTRDPGTDTAPVWTPDGQAIAYRSDRDGGGLFLVRAGGDAPPERLTPPDGRLRTPYAFTPDGQTLLFTEFRSYRDQGIGAVTLGGTRAMRTVVDGPPAELRPALSPDGRWLAYQAEVAGRFEVFVARYPDLTGEPRQLSVEGGTSPNWSPDGRELFFHDGRAMVSLPVSAIDAPRAPGGPPRRLFEAQAFAGRLGPVYSVSPDGQRFLFVREDPERDSAAARRHLLVVQHWTTELAAALAAPAQ